MIAALPMYDFRSCGRLMMRSSGRRLPSAWWRRVCETCRRACPRGFEHRETWRHPVCCLGQACEYPLAKSFGEHLAIVATPRYSAPGCTGLLYKSAVIVRAGRSCKLARGDARAALCGQRARFEQRNELAARGPRTARGGSRDSSVQ